MSEKRDLWVPLVLLAAGIALAIAHLTKQGGDSVTAILAGVLGLGGALACLPIRLRHGPKRLVTFAVGVGLLMVPLFPLAGGVSLQATVGWFVLALAFLLPFRGVPESTRRLLLGTAVGFALLGLLAAAGVLPGGLAWLFLAGALHMGIQVVTTRPKPVAEIPTGPLACVFGGSFDPFHRGHRALCEAALRTHDRLLVVVAGSAPHKFADEEGDVSDVTPFHHRVAMTRLGVTGLPRTEVLELEGRRNGPSYTVDTLEVLQRSHPPGTRFRLLLGADMYADFPSWRDWRRILGMADLVVALRPGYDLADPPEFEGLGIKAARLEAPEVLVSSTDLRRRIQRGRDVADLLSGGVRQYIGEHALYQPHPEAPPRAT